MKIIQKYYRPDGTLNHTYEDEYNKTSYYCLNCGKQQVYESESYDYCEGPRLMCTCCGYHHNLPRPPDESYEEYTQVLEQLRESEKNNKYF